MDFIIYLKIINYLIKIIFLIFIFAYLLIIKKFAYKLIENQLKNYVKYNKKRLPIIYYQNELSSTEKYVKLLRQNLIKVDNFLYEILKPKISFVVTSYNKQQYLNQFITSIQNQLIKEFEIIIIDDFSNDNSTKIINEKIKTDKRLKLIQNQKNMGSLYGRSIGVIHSKGEYIIFVDSDDIILKDGLLKVYNYAKKKNLDMVNFYTIFEDKNQTYVFRRKFDYKKIIYQPILSYIYYYDGIEENTALWDKLIKRDNALQSINYIGETIYKERIIIENDVIILFSLLRNSKSFQYVDIIGYYYVMNNNDSITNTRNNTKKSNDIIRSIFLNMLFLYEHTDNSFFDKKIVVFKLSQAYRVYEKAFNSMNNGYNLIIKLLNKLLYSKFISLNDKLFISTVKNKILKKNDSYLRK